MNLMMAIKLTLLLVAVVAGLVLADAKFESSFKYSVNYNDFVAPKKFLKDKSFSGEQVTFEYYYEVLCPGCQQVYQELPDLVDKLGESVLIATFPYGNAETDPKTKEVTCQHGEAECYGNMLHACAIDTLQQFKKYIKYNACTISKGADDDAADSCGKKLGVDSNAVKSCAKSDRGKDLLVWYGEHTVDHEYTPWVVINGKKWDLETPIVEAVCKAFTNPPPACKKALSTHL